MRKLIYKYPAAFADVSTDPITRFIQAWDCWKKHGDKSAARFYARLGWDRLWGIGWYKPGGEMDKLFKGWREAKEPVIQDDYH